jgi:hypothetical protein
VGGVGVNIIFIKEEGGVGGGGGDVERKKVRRAWSAKGRQEIDKCWNLDMWEEILVDQDIVHHTGLPTMGEVCKVT